MVNYFPMPEDVRAELDALQLALERHDDAAIKLQKGKIETIFSDPEMICIVGWTANRAITLNGYRRVGGLFQGPYAFASYDKGVLQMNERATKNVRT
jgi:hypothetical protein